MRELVFKLSKNDKIALGTVRCMDNLLIAIDEDDIWLKGIFGEPDIKLMQLPVKKTFVIDKHDQLFLQGAIVPICKLKKLTWQSLSSFITVEAPTSAMPVKKTLQVPIRLIASTDQKEGMALITALQVWKNYAETASSVRLSLLKFAVSEKNEVIIIGHPLPALPGKEYWINNNILLPCGYNFELEMVIPFINEKLNANNDSIIFFNNESEWQKIEHTFFVEAKRSAVRKTTGYIND